MDLIFDGGKRLYFKLHPAEFFEKCIGTKLHKYQKQVLNQSNNNPKIYGDDFLIEIISQNCQDNFVLSIKDYNENQEKECEININFNEKELGQFIQQLQFYYDSWGC